MGKWTYQIPRTTWKPAALAAGKIPSAVLHSFAAYVLTTFAELEAAMAFKSAAQSVSALHEPSAFLSPRAKPRVPAAEARAGKAVRAREKVEARIVIVVGSLSSKFGACLQRLRSVGIVLKSLK